MDLTINGPEHIRPLASESISDPRLVSLIAVPEQLEPMLAQLWRGAMDPPRRKELSEPILKMFAKVRWIIPQSGEQKDEILHYLIPDLNGYLTDTQLETITDDAEKAEAIKLRDAAWYVADRLGQAVAELAGGRADAVRRRLAGGGRRRRRPRRGAAARAGGSRPDGDGQPDLRAAARDRDPARRDGGDRTAAAGGARDAAGDARRSMSM